MVSNRIRLQPAGVQAVVTQPEVLEASLRVVQPPAKPNDWKPEFVSCRTAPHASVLIRTAGIAGFFVYRLGDSTPELLDGQERFALDAYINSDAHTLYELGAVTRPCSAGGIERLSYTSLSETG